MTIDEAIAREKELAEIYRNDIVPKEDYHNMPWIDMENELNMRRAKEHEQLAEWLEELKAIKDDSLPIIHGKADLNRKIRLTEAGYDYNAVQKRVNEII